MNVFSILVFFFSFIVGAFVTDMILNNRYIERWKKEYRQFHDAQICKLKRLCLTMLHYVDATETIWKDYTGMLEGYEIITKIFETLDKHPEMTEAEQIKLLRDIRPVALAHYNECRGSDTTYAKLLGIIMGAEHGKVYQEIKEELRIMKEDIHDIDEETEGMVDKKVKELPKNQE